MAPKRQRLVGSSSSSHPSVDEDAIVEEGVVKFVNSEAESEYGRLVRKGVIRERRFVPRDNEEMVAMVNVRGWKVFCELANDVPLNVVREFYANASVEQNNSTIVRGQQVDYSPRAIRNLIGQLPKSRGVEDWGRKTVGDVDLDVVIGELCVPGAVWKCKAGTNEKRNFPAASLTKFARAWFLFICTSILPSSHVTEVTVDRAILLWGILKGEYVDLGYLINQTILRFLKGNSTASIPYASIITGLCDVAKVSPRVDEPMQKPMAPIADSSIGRMKEGEGGVSGAGGHVAEGSGVARAGSQQSTGNMSTLESYLRRMNRRLDAMHVSSRQYSEDMGVALEAKFQSPSTLVQWPIFGSRIPYPPTDSSDEDDEDDEGDDSEDE